MARPTLLTARTEFASALNQICTERGITPESVIETIKSAILAAYKKDYGLEEDYQYQVELDPETGAAKLYQHEEDKPKQKKEITPPGFGRIAAQTAKQVILQKIREAEKSAILDEYQDKVDQLVNGRVLRFDGKNILFDIGRGQGWMPPQEQVINEQYRLNKRFTLYIRGIQETLKGKKVVVSRAAEELVSLLFKREVPEVNSGAVEIKIVAREPGHRSKVAVVSTQPGVDPVGSCVGQKGVRVQAVIEELEGEKIDIIQHSDDPVKFITAALSPAENLDIEINEEKKQAEVTVPEDQLSLAIGKDGQNVRLAAKLTGYKIDIQGPEGKPAEKTAKEKKEPVEKTEKKTKKAKQKKTVKKKPAKKKTKEKKKSKKKSTAKKKKAKAKTKDSQQAKSKKKKKKKGKDKEKPAKK